MSVSVKLILTLVIGYLLGSISTGVIVSRVFGHKDIRSEGSGNSGTTNMLRVMGKKYALLTFAGDLLKGIVAVLIGKAWLGTQAGEIVGGRDGGRRRFGGGGRLGKQAVDGEGHSPDGKDEQQQEHQYKAHAETHQGEAFA